MNIRCPRRSIPCFQDSILITILVPFLFSVSIIDQVATAQQNSISQTQTDKQVLLTVTVTDKRNRLVSNLSQSSFTVLDEGKPQEITSFNNKDIPLSLGIIFDTSNSMITRDVKRLTGVKEGLARFLRLGNPSNEYFLMSFDQQPQLVADWTRDAHIVIKALEPIAPKQSNMGSALFDACYMAIEKLMGGTHFKRVILLITDGQDNQSRHKYTEMRRLLQESGVVVYAIGIFDPEALKSIGQDVLNEMTNLSGGIAVYPPDDASMLETFEAIAFELKQQYLIGLRASGAGESSKLRKLKVEVKVGIHEQPASSSKLEGLKARTRQGYYTVKRQ
jgi:Ca-activated chloride channel homolog